MTLPPLIESNEYRLHTVHHDLPNLIGDTEARSVFTLIVGPHRRYGFAFV